MSSTFWDEVVKVLKTCFLDKKTPPEKTLAFAVEFWKSAPERSWNNNKFYGTNLLQDPFCELFVRVASKNLDSALFYFDQLHENTQKLKQHSPSYVCSSSENPIFFFEFAKLAQEKRPVYYSTALLNIIYSESKCFNEASKKLIDFAQNTLFSMLTDQASFIPFDPEIVCRALILNSKPNTSWFYELAPMLWKIEKSKSAYDELSKTNFWFIAQNCDPKNSSLLQEVHSAFSVWAYHYKGFTLSTLNTPYNFIDHTQNLIFFIEFQRGIGNILTANEKSAQLQTSQIADQALTAYWSMVEWLESLDSPIYFYILGSAVSYLNEAITNTTTTKNLLKQSREKIASTFEDFAKKNKNESIKVLAYMIYNFRFQHCRDSNWNLLDYIHSLLFEIDPEAAKKAVTDGSNSLMRHVRKWTPEKHYT